MSMNFPIAIVSCAILSLLNRSSSSTLSHPIKAVVMTPKPPTFGIFEDSVCVDGCVAAEREGCELDGVLPSGMSFKTKPSKTKAPRPVMTGFLLAKDFKASALLLTTSPLLRKYSRILTDKAPVDDR